MASNYSLTSTGPVAAVTGALSDVHTTAQNPIGTEVVGTDAVGHPATYVYMQGVASCAVGSWVVFDELFVTTLTVANALGAVAIAMGVVDASTKYGWFARQGAIHGLCLSGYADNAKVWVTSTPGSIDDTDVAVDLVINAIGRSARATSGTYNGMALFQIDRPFCLNEVQN